MASYTQVDIGQLKSKLHKRIDFRRTMVLDLFETLIGDHKQWPLIRKNILNLFGDTGIKQDIEELLSEVT